MVNYEFQAGRIGRMSDYIDRRTATLGLHMACLEQQARELRRDAENMRRVVIGDSVDDPAHMAKDTERLLAALRRLASCMEAAACARTVLHVFERWNLRHPSIFNACFSPSVCLRVSRLASESQGLPQTLS